MPAKTKILILQHPQEAKQPLSTVPLILEQFPDAVLRVGLSWGNLAKALKAEADPKRWVVLYVGTQKDADRFKDKGTVVVTDRKGINILSETEDLVFAKPNQGAELDFAPAGASSESSLRPVACPDEAHGDRRRGIALQGRSLDIDGIVLLDGNWRQSKAMWWRNSWLLKLRRMLLFPDKPSLYGKLRKEPRRNTVSTLEALGLALTYLEKDAASEEALLTRFKAFLESRRN